MKIKRLSCLGYRHCKRMKKIQIGWKTSVQISIPVIRLNCGVPPKQQVKGHVQDWWTLKNERFMNEDPLSTSMTCTVRQVWSLSLSTYDIQSTVEDEHRRSLILFWYLYTSLDFFRCGRAHSPRSSGELRRNLENQESMEFLLTLTTQSQLVSSQ